MTTSTIIYSELCFTRDPLNHIISMYGRPNIMLLYDGLSVELYDTIMSWKLEFPQIEVRLNIVSNYDDIKTIVSVGEWLVVQPDYAKK
jgi:hypothetical protein